MRIATLAALLLATLPRAQQAAAGVPLLRVASNEARWIEPFAELFHVALPALAPEQQRRQQLELLMPAGRAASVRCSDDPFKTRTLVVEVRAAAWLGEMADAVRAAERQLTVRAEGLAKLAGLPAHAARSLCQELFATARSLESLVAVVTQVGDGRQYDLRLELVPTPDSTSANWLGKIAPSTSAPAQLPWPDAALRLAVGVHGDAFAEVCAPFVPLVAAFTAPGSDPGVAIAESLATLALLDGSFHLALQQGRLGLVYGLRDADTFSARANDPERLRRQQEELARQRVEAEFTPRALTHRGVPLLRSRVRGSSPLPGLADADGYLVAFGARVGNLWLQVGGSDESPDPMKGAIDDALAGNLRGPSAASPASAERAWLTCEVDLVRLGSMAGAPAAVPMDAAATDNNAPSRLRVSLSSSPHSLKALIQMR